MEIRLRAGPAWLDGWMRFDEKPQVGDRVDFHRDLGADEAVPWVGLETAFLLESWALTASVVGPYLSSSETIRDPMRWNETLFQVGETVRARLWLLQAAVGVERHVEPWEGIELRPGLAVRYLRYHIRLSSDAQETDDDNIGTAAVEPGLQASWAVAPAIRLEASAAVTSWSTERYSVRGWRVEPGLRWEAADSISLLLAWRWERLRVRKETFLERNVVSQGIEGLILGIEARF